MDVFADEIKFFQLGTEAMAKYQELEGFVFDGSSLKFTLAKSNVGVKYNSLTG